MKFVLTGDWHIRRKTPVCRKSDIFQTVLTKLRFIHELAEANEAVVLCSGDIFDKPSFNADTINALLEVLPEDDGAFYGCIGNHDVPAHRTEALTETALGTLMLTKRMRLVCSTGWQDGPKKVRCSFFNWGQKITPPKHEARFHVAVSHQMTWSKQKPWEDCSDLEANALLEAHPEYDLIVTGHNHKSFVCKQGSRMLVNPGGLLRLTADEIDRKPCVYLYDTDARTIQRIIVPHKVEDITNDHTQETAERDERIQEFVSKMKTGFGLTLDFEQNLNAFMQMNKTRDTVRELIMEALHGH